MPNVVVPESGWTLGTAAESISNSKGPGTPNFAPGTKQLMRLQFTEGPLLEALIKAGEFKVSFGKTITFLYGNEAQEVLSKSEQLRHEIYETTKDSLSFVGLITHQFEARKLEREQDDAADLLALKQQMSALKNQKESKSTMLVGAKGPPSRKAAAIGFNRPSSTDLKALAKTSAKKTAETEAKLDALRAPIIHLLALGSDTERNIALRTHAPVDLCLRILQRIGNRTRAGNHWELVDDMYRDLDLWKFPYGSEKDRDTAIDNAKAALIRLRVPAGAAEWDRLVKPEDRGKVKIGPPPPSLPKTKALPNLNVPKPGEGRITPAEVSPTASEGSVGAEQLARSTSSQPPTKTRRVGGTSRIDKIIANKGKPQKASKEAAKEKKGVATAVGAAAKKLGRPPKPKTEATPKPTKRPTKWKHPEGGIAAVSQSRDLQPKSKEFVESDSEPEVNTKVASKSPMTLGPQSIASKVAGKSPKVAGKSPLPTTSHGQARIETPKQNASTASPAIKKVSEAAKITKPSTTPPPAKITKPSTTPPPAKKGVATKSLPAKPEPDPESAPEKTPKERPIAKATGSKRPVTAKGKEGKLNDKEQLRTVSPTKRSPLSSPPTTAQETRSVSSTPKTQASTNTVPTPTRSPSVLVSQPAAKKQPRYAQETTTTVTKRKADRSEGEATKAVKRPKLPDATLNLAKRFKEEYAKYERLYKEVQDTSEGPLLTERLKRVLKMHNDLTALKSKLVNLAAA